MEDEGSRAIAHEDMRTFYSALAATPAAHAFGFTKMPMSGRLRYGVGEAKSLA